jgi:S-adenosylmethionine hydrolase
VNRIITLTTDFGTRDWFVGAMKGVILGIAPGAAVVDVTHDIPPGDIRAGAFALAAGCRFFPKGTVHVVVVDPGVGGARGAIAVQTVNHFFVAPDNGVLSLAVAREAIRDVRRLENEEFFLHPVSRTFHGRDVFAPVGAHLSRGISIRRLGRAQEEFVRLPWPEPRVYSRRIEGEVVYIDGFGNAITNIRTATLADRGGAAFAGRKRLGPLKSFYQSVGAGQAAAVPGSSGFVEIAVNGGSAARRLGLRVGMPITVR